MRRKLVSSLGVLLGISLAGCSISAVNTSGNGDELKVWLYVTEEEFADFNKIVDEWAAENNQQVEVSRKEGEIGEYIAMQKKYMNF